MFKIRCWRGWFGEEVLRVADCWLLAMPSRDGRGEGSFWGTNPIHKDSTMT